MRNDVQLRVGALGGRHCSDAQKGPHQTVRDALVNQTE